MCLLRKAVDAAGGVEKAAKLCGVSPRAVYKWLKAGSLPRTDYTGETRYAELLSGASDGEVAANVLLAETSPAGRLTAGPIFHRQALGHQSREIAVISSSARIENDLERLGTPGRD